MSEAISGLRCFTRHAFAFSRRGNARAVPKFVALKSKGARECRAPVHPQPRMRRGSGQKCTRVFTASSPKSPGIPARNGLRLIRILPGDRAFLPPSPCEMIRKTWRQRRGVRTTRLRRPQSSALVRSAARVHRISSRVRDDRDTPLMWDKTAMDMPVIWVSREAAIFLAMGIDSPNHTKSSPSGATFFLSSPAAGGGSARMERSAMRDGVGGSGREMCPSNRVAVFAETTTNVGTKE
jgi:hypothetical protein